MGAAAIITALQVGTSLIGSLREQDAIESQADAQMDEYKRQMQEEEKLRRQEASDAARAADKRAAAAIAAMEATGGAGSQNEARIEAEIHGAKALDLARISENSRGRQAMLEANLKATRKDAELAIQQSRANFAESAAGAGANYLNLRDAGGGGGGADAGSVSDSPFGSKSSQLSSRSTVSTGSRAQ